MKLQRLAFPYTKIHTKDIKNTITKSYQIQLQNHITKFPIQNQYHQKSIYHKNTYKIKPLKLSLQRRITIIYLR